MAHRAGRYRQDIQGLRAVAVGVIVVFHAFPAVLPGGFVGVDIFFVISGFLITGILYRDIAGGDFSLADFYRKRVRRIFPALFVMLTVTVLAGYLILSPEAYAELGRNALSAVFFVSNIDFWWTSGYFDRAAELRPLLHTWSLAVEEQFYIVFPVALVLVMRFARALVLPLLAAGFVISLWLAEMWASRPEPTLTAYFLTPFRVYELLLGGLAALAPVPALCERRGVRDAAVALSLGMIAAAVVLFSPWTPFPGVTALLPTVGTALILYVGRAGASRLSWPLTAAPMLFVGAISYSLYLWHWPVYAFLRVASQPGHPGPAAILAATVLAFGLAALSHRFVEEPVSRRAITGTRFLTLGGAGMAACALVAVGIWQSNGMPSRFAPATLNLFAAAEDISPARRRCHRGPGEDRPYEATCVLGATDGLARTVVWGDSHGVELAYALGERMAETGGAVRQVTGSACPPVTGLDLPDRPSCRAANTDILAALTADEAVDRVILTLNAAGYISGGLAFVDLYATLTETVVTLRASGKQVLLIGQIPNQGTDVPAVAGQAAHHGRDLSRMGLSRAEHAAVSADWNAALEALATGDAGTGFVDPAPHLCGPEICPIVREGAVIYFDGSHVNMAGARHLVPAVVAAGR